MISFEFSYDMPASVPYAAVLDGTDVIYVVNCARAAALPSWLRETAINEVSRRLDERPRAVRRDAQVIDLDELRALRQARHVLVADNT